MHWVLLALACFVCTGGHGRRLQAPIKYIQRSWGTSQKVLDALAASLLALNPAIAFNHFSPRSVHPGQRRAVSMMRTEAPIGESDIESGWVEESGLESDHWTAAVAHEAYRSSEFWVEVDEHIPNWRQRPELSRFREFCQNLRTKESGAKVHLPNGQELLEQYIYPGLDGPPQRQEYPESDFDELQQLRERLEEEVAPVARREFSRLMEAIPLESDDSCNYWDKENSHTWQHAAWYGWQYLPLRKAWRYMPETSLALRKAMGDSGPAHRFVGIARQKADCDGNVHSDGRNYMLSTLTPILAPPGNGIIVNELMVEIATGGHVIILDNTYPHQVYNEADEDRFVLVAECWHPLLTSAERDALATLFALEERFSSLQLNNIPWAYDINDVMAAIDSGNANDIAFWKDTVGYLSEQEARTTMASAS